MPRGVAARHVAGLASHLPVGKDAIFVGSTTGQVDWDLVSPAEEVVWLRMMFEKNGWHQLPIALWAGAKVPAAVGGELPTPSSMGETYRWPSMPIVVDAHGVVRGYFPASTPQQTAILAQVLAYSRAEASGAAAPKGLRLGGGPTTVEEMIAGCEEGIYINRVANLELLDWPSGVMTGVTQGGCYFVEHGKITRSVKNFRFVDSPVQFLDNVVALGTPHRAALGFSPWGGDWPLPPVIVPPAMVRDFNFVRLAEEV